MRRIICWIKGHNMQKTSDFYWTQGFFGKVKAKVWKCSLCGKKEGYITEKLSVN